MSTKTTKRAMQKEKDNSMYRLTQYIRQWQADELRRRQDVIGISQAETVRRALTDYFERNPLDTSTKVRH